MERDQEEKSDERDSVQETESSAEERGEEQGGREEGEDSSQSEDGAESGDGEKKDSPGKREPTEEEKEKQREEDARAAQERLEEVMDAPPEEHDALKADALGSTIMLIGALFVIFGVIVALAFSPWGWVGALIGVVEVIVGQLIRRRGTASGG